MLGITVFMFYNKLLTKAKKEHLKHFLFSIVDLLDEATI